MRSLDYQTRVLGRLDRYLTELAMAKGESDKVAQVAKDAGVDIPIPDFTEKAWGAMGDAGQLPASRAGIPFSPRADGIGRPVPNATLKVPTGGGKTFLAVNAVSRIMGRWQNSNSGFVLWIVPNEAIYSQTLARLKDRQHPYRQTLDRAAAGRVKIMEKTDRLDARDVETQLCVMVLMLQSANRQTQDSLKMFQDRGDVHGFTPAEGEQEAHRALLDTIPNLAAYNLADSPVAWPMVKDSLGNALRIIRPVVVVDEGQKAISELAFNTLYGFNPSFVLELSATPKDVKAKGGANPKPARFANLLVEVTGRELDDEGMIKMPLNLNPKQGTDWKATLATALGTLDEIDAAAKAYRADGGRYIRPIILVQVERTGADQRDSTFIHADDVRDYLLTLGFDEAEIAIKSAEQNDLSQPENQDLLSPTNRVRAIITKQALQEGWDCPFAYVLCSLAASSNQNAMTQLVGRILRQPHATKTGVGLLDECHVITHHAGTRDVVTAIKSGLEKDGLGDLVLQVEGGETAKGAAVTRNLPRRRDFATLDIYLPMVLRVMVGKARKLDYETDLLASIDWRGFDVSPIAADIPESGKAPNAQLQRISIAESGDGPFVNEGIGTVTEKRAFDPAYAVRMISDLVPNPFVARDIVGDLVDALAARGFTADKLGDLATLILERLRDGLEKARNAKAETLFRQQVEDGQIQFRLRIDGNNWKMPHTMQTTLDEDARKLVGSTGEALERSLFVPVYEAELNKDEQGVAIHLDGEEAILWWHRNVARAQYALQGWQRARVYPDFIFACRCVKDGGKIVLLETKGDHLDNPDTAYKRDLLHYLTEHFQWEESVDLALENTGEAVEGELILMNDIKAKLPSLISG